MSATLQSLPAHLVDSLISALADHQAGRLESAERAYRGVLDTHPTHPNALYLLGILLAANGRSTAAIGLLERAVIARSGDDESRLALADALAADGRRDEAIGLYRAILQDNPRQVAAIVNMANALRDDGAAEAAVAACRRALAINPRLVAAHITLGSALLAAGAPAKAIGAYRTATTLAAESGPARVGLAMALLRDGRVDSAVSMAGRAVHLVPDLAEAWFVRGAALRAQHQFERAVAALRRAVELEPLHARAQLTLGNALLDLDEYDEAEDHLRVAIAADPDLAEAHASLGFLLTGRGRYADAIAACDAAIACRPGFAHAYWNRSFAHMLAGDFARGWEDYEWRRRHDRFAADLAPLPGPEWGGEDPAGKTILVTSEQGLGDTIQFARYLPMLAARGARVLLACPRALMPLLARIEGVAGVVSRNALPSHDMWVNQMSLPRLFGTRADSIPAASGYIVADPALVAHWRTETPPRPRVGIVWGGNPGHSNDSRRSMPAIMLAPIVSVPGVDWVNLQVGDHSHELSTRYGIADLSAGMTDFAQTAALVATLDLVIAVDTSTAHLAGAMGKPVWIMLPFAPDWRWLPGDGARPREDTPWYASARLFRQTRPGDWMGVAEAVTRALGERYGARNSSEVPSAPSVAANAVTTTPQIMSTTATSVENPAIVARFVMS